MKQIPEQYVYPKFRKHILAWMKIFTPICIANSFLPYFFNAVQYPSYEYFVMSLPVVNLAVICLILFIHTLYWWLDYEKYFETQYLKNNYPAIWKKLHPWGHFSINGFAGICFLLGKYDDGGDEKLNQIKQNQKENWKMILWVFLLVPVVWISNMARILISKII
jgi:hypothetical protein